MARRPTSPPPTGWDGRERPEAAAATGAGGRAWWLVDPSGRRRRAAHAALRSGGGALFAGSWREGLVRPFAGLVEALDRLVERAAETDSALVERYQLPLANLLPARRREPDLAGAPELTSGLANFAFRGHGRGLLEFYWRRDVGPWITAELVHLALDAADALAESGAGPAILWLEGLEHADRRSLDALRLLGAYAPGRPLTVCAVVESPAVVADWGEPWRALPPMGRKAGGAGPSPSRLPAGARRAVEAAAVFALPFTDDAWREVARGDDPGRRPPPEAAADLVERGILGRGAGSRLGFTLPALREAAHRRLAPDRRRRLHAAALAAEGADPFAAAWHARESASPEAARRQIAAIERAWALSDTAGARALSAGLDDDALRRRGADPDVFAALLEYDSGRHREVEAALTRAIERGGGDAVLLHRLLGYNAIFGLGEFARGAAILAPLAAEYETAGRTHEAAAVRNAIAFALARLGRAADAIASEETALQSLAGAEGADGFLARVVQLNLGRLHRNLGASDRALALFARAMDDRKTDFSPYMLLIFHSALAQLHAARGDLAEAHAAYHRCSELTRDLRLENASYPVFEALVRPLGGPPRGRMLGGDELRFGLFLSLAAACRRLGLDRRAAAYRTALRAFDPLLGEEALGAAMAALDAVGRVEAGGASPVDRDLPTVTAGVEDRFADLLAVSARGPEAEAATVDALAAGEAVALFRRRTVGPGVWIRDALVLHDPRSAAAAARVHAEVGAEGGPAARCALALAGELGRFRGALGALPLIVQEATLRPGHRRDLAGLEPIRLRIQVLVPDLDGELFTLLRDFARRTGVGLLAVAPFHLRQRDLPAAPDRAIAGFLVTGVDRLLLDDRLLAKTHGADADVNLLSFRPRLTRSAAVETDPDGTLRAVIRVWSYTRALRLRREVRPLLDLCDGSRSVGEILDRPEVADLGPRRQLCDFLRGLWRHQVIVFDEPDPPAVLARGIASEAVAAPPQGA